MKTTRFAHPFAPAVAGVVCVLALAACGSSSSKSTPTTTGTAAPAAPKTRSTQTAPAGTTSEANTVVVTVTKQGITASMHPHSHHPVAEHPWPISFTVTRAGKPLQASVSYEYLFGGQVVAHRSHYTFHGHFADTFLWPNEAVGYPLTFRAVIVASGVTIDLDYPVQVVK